MKIPTFNEYNETPSKVFSKAFKIKPQIPDVFNPLDALDGIKQVFWLTEEGMLEKAI